MKLLKIGIFIGTSVAAGALVRKPVGDLVDLPNRLPEAAPYVVSEARALAPPFEEHWQTQNHPAQCRTCHAKIFDQWNGSMMSNSWRDPAWRAAFLLLSREVSTSGECDTPVPPDGTPRAAHNPFARPGACASEYDLGGEKVTVSRPGSLLDGFCSRCHMPTNYIDNVPLRTVTIDPVTHLEKAPVDPRFNPTSDNGTGYAFATVDLQLRNTESGKTGIFCAICHSVAATRDTPFHTFARTGIEYTPAVGRAARADLLPAGALDRFGLPDGQSPTFGFGIGAGAYRLSPHAIAYAERFGPMAAGLPPQPIDDNTAQVFGEPVPYQVVDATKHKGFYQALLVRSEMCGTCHDVTNALPIKNPLGRWVGGFPIERTYSEWATSRYADRPGNASYDPRHKRDCQSCHMQQDRGQPGTAQTLYDAHDQPLPIPTSAVADGGAPRPFFTHHFVGGNALVPRLLGKDLDEHGSVSPYPELSVYSFSSADHASPYSRAVWIYPERKGAFTQQARLAWDRLRHVVWLEISGPASTQPGTPVPIAIRVTNTGSGHDFPTGFPEGRIAWLAVHAYDLASGAELPIHDSVWDRTTLGVGGLTTEETVDPSFPGCGWRLPPASVDPFAVQFKAVASLGDGCPTLDLPYAAPLNLATDAEGLPVDAEGRRVDAAHPDRLPQFRDLNGNGDLYDDSFLRDSRLRPLPHAGAAKAVDQYSVVVPLGVRGPIAISAAVYYQSLESVVASKFLGNLVDTDGDMVLEPCVLGGLCDGRTPSSEPAVVEGAPPVTMAVRSLSVSVAGSAPPAAPLRIGVYPETGAQRAHVDTVVKVFASAPVSGVDARSFVLRDATGARVPALVDAVGDGAYGLFPDSILLVPGATYGAHLDAGICDAAGQCTSSPIDWRFTVAADEAASQGDSSIPAGFSARR